MKLLWNFAVFLAPLAPCVVRAVLALRYRGQLSERLGDEQRDTEAHRAQLLTLAGFSFSGLIAVIVLNATLRYDFHTVIYYLLLSFLGFLLSLNIQGYKFTRGLDLFSTAVMDTATLSLILAIVAMLFAAGLDVRFASATSVLACSVWLLDFLWRVRLDSKYFHDVMEAAINAEDRPRDSNNDEERQLSYSKCLKHGVTYPKGGSCPKCNAEAQER